MNPLFAELPTSIFEAMSMAARAQGAVNLGQGFPDFGWPDDVIAKAAEALTEAAPTNIRRCAACPSCARRSPPITGVTRGSTLDPEQVIVTSGATEALAASLLALIEPGDEVVLFQPLYDAYLPLVLRAGGVPQAGAARPRPTGGSPQAALAEAFTPAHPARPVQQPAQPDRARLFDADELALLAEACVGARRDRRSADEVWEHLVFDGRALHAARRAARHGGADGQDRLGRQDLLADRLEGRLGGGAAGARRADRQGAPVRHLHHRRPTCRARRAYGLGKDDDYFAGDARRLRRPPATRCAPRSKRRAMRRSGCEGTYFLCVDLAASGIALGRRRTSATRAVAEAGVAAIPVSAFYAEAPVTNVIRLCFAKQPETIAAGVAALAKARDSLGTVT